MVSRPVAMPNRDLSLGTTASAVAAALAAETDARLARGQASHVLALEADRTPQLLRGADPYRAALRQMAAVTEPDRLRPFSAPPGLITRTPLALPPPTPGAAALRHTGPWVWGAPDDTAMARGRCTAPPAFADWTKPMPKRPAVSLSGDAYGLALAKMAKRQLREIVIYSAKYEALPFPRGDLPGLHGSCSDVIIRAYRALGFDLQEAVQRAKVGSGDKNIDHRRTNTLRKLFARFGAELPVTFFPENYKPGDIVTYYRPFSRVSRAHIAIVSDEIAPTGRPYIIHNRGYNVQQEDALFVDQITGHYRFRPNAPADPVAVAGRASGNLRVVTGSARARARAVKRRQRARPRRPRPAYALGGPRRKQ
ncbi:MAG: DUF1287 domain-containing protein [Pseudomonadota bacterium]